MYRNIAMESLYSGSSLGEIFRTANMLSLDDPGNRDFSKFHRAVLQDRFVGVRFDFLATSSIELDRSFNPRDVQSVLLNLSDKIIDNYELVAEHDIIAPAVYANPGRMIEHTMIKNPDAWQDHPFYTNHCEIFDIQQALMVGYLYPGKDWKFVTVEYLGAMDNLTWKQFDYTQLELATFPFALAWLFRNGAIDDTRLIRYFDALSDLTNTQLRHLRKYINSPYKKLAQQAAELGTKENTLKKSLYALRDKVAHRFDWTSGSEPTDRQLLRPLEADYHFMTMLGDPSNLMLPS